MSRHYFGAALVQPKARVATLFAATAFALATANPCGAASVIATTDSQDAFYSAAIRYTHWANGYYWVAFHRGTLTGPGPGPVLYSSPDGVSWTQQGEIFINFNPSDTQWATRYSGNDIIALAFRSDNNRYYRHGTLNGAGTVAWDTAAELAAGPVTGTWPYLNALIANGKPIMWRDNTTADGTLRIGTQLNGPGWSDTLTNAPSLAAATTGLFRAGAIYQTGGADPNDLIVLRATTLGADTPGAHRLVAVKYDADLDAYDGSWFNVSTCCGLTEGDATEVVVTGSAMIIQRFAAVRDTDGNLHAVYINQLGDVVHYRKDVGFNDTWSRLHADVTKAASVVQKVALTSAALNNLYLFYVIGSERIIRYRHFNGTDWGPQNTLYSGSVDLNDALAPIESATGCSIGLAWSEGAGPIYDIKFELITGDCPTAETTVYRSVGITATDLNTGLETVGISGSTATFSGPLPLNIGVGDVLVYNSGGARLAFIHGRTSSNVFSVADKNGGTPTAAPALTAVAVYRAYTSLKTWESQIENPNINEPVENDVNPSTDLVTANTVMMVACYGDGEDTASAYIDGWTTGPDNYIKIYTPINPNEVGTSQRHDGKWSTSAYRISQDGGYFAPIGIVERYVRIEGLQIESNLEFIGQSNGIQISDGNSDAAVEIHISNSIIRMTATPPISEAYGIGALNGFGDVSLNKSLYVTKLWNNIIYDYTVSGGGGTCFYAQDYGTVYAYNNTCVGGSGAQRGIAAFGVNLDFYVKNNITIDSTDPYVGTFHAASTNNVSDIGDAPGSNPINGEPTFVNKAGDDYHLASADTVAQDAAANLSSDSFLAFTGDIDGGGRTVLWDIGADDVLATTAVELVSFKATGLDGEVRLEWETGSELNNLGFHLYRGTLEEGPYECITASIIPGLGSSPEGARYRYLDMGLTNGITYYYKLEDIETTGKTELHGLVSATPQAGAPSASGEETSGQEESGSDLITYGKPEANSFRVLERGASHVVLELITEGFYLEPRADGTARLSVPGYEAMSQPYAPSIPVKRSWVEAVAGLKVSLTSIRAQSVESLSGLRLSGAEVEEVVAGREGTVGLRRRSRSGAEGFRQEGFFPERKARLLGVGFQGDVKKVQVELAPLRWDDSQGRLVWARRLVVHLSFQGRDRREVSPDGRRGRLYRRRPSHTTRGVVARLVTREKGLYSIGYGEVFQGSGVARSALRLSRQGNSVLFHTEPKGERFGPGARLYFVGEGAEANPYGREALYELELSGGGEPMEVVSASPSGEETAYYWEHLKLEEQRFYQAGLVDAPDLWLWDLLFAPVTKSYPLELEGVAAEGEGARLSVWLQGVSDFGADPDHHLRLYVNGSFFAEASWNGKNPQRVEGELGAGVLREGENLLEIENVGDTAAAYSMVMLDRIELDYPRQIFARAGRLGGRWSQSGAATLEGVGSLARVLDVTDPEKPRWLSGTETTAEGAVRFRAEAGRSYLGVSDEAVLRPEVRRPRAARLKRVREGADYLVIGPEAFLTEAAPLVELRRRQALRVRAVAVEDVYEEFGFGETRPEAVREFLEYAYHRWPQPPPRYVLLLGDATYDYKDYLGTGVVSRVPALLVKTSYLWTASDPTLAAVNGDDILPDLALGRLPAANVEELRAMVAKILAFEESQTLESAPLALVTDNPDEAGDFVANAEEIAAGVLAGRDVLKLHLTELGTSAMRQRIVETFDSGASLVSYIGHGGIHLWADENLFNTGGVASLAPQPKQPLLLTLNCLNGYFHFPYFNSLAEEIVKAQGKGAVAAFSPSGLSLDAPAHQFHKLLLEEIFNHPHPRLGDAVLAAQGAYAETGSFPELLTIYHLFGDPAMTLH